MLSLQRQIVSNTVLSMTYVGNVGRHALVDQEANPSTPSVCLGVSQPNQVAAGSNICGPNAETGVFTTASGQVIQARQQAGLGPNFGSDGWFRTEGGSAYNALEVSLQYNHGRTAILGAYTYSKSLDNSSSVTEQVQPFNPGLLWGLSSFNIKHNFVTSYSYELPFDKAFRHSDQLTRGWILSGITRFSTGFPITMMENDDHSLIGNTTTGPTATRRMYRISLRAKFLPRRIRETEGPTSTLLCSALKRSGNSETPTVDSSVDPVSIILIWPWPKIRISPNRCLLSFDLNSSMFSTTRNLIPQLV